jgi:hypothetical protein
MYIRLYPTHSEVLFYFLLVTFRGLLGLLRIDTVLRTVKSLWSVSGSCFNFAVSGLEEWDTPKIQMRHRQKFRWLGTPMAVPLLPPASPRCLLRITQFYPQSCPPPPGFKHDVFVGGVLKWMLGEWQRTLCETSTVLTRCRNKMFVYSTSERKTKKKLFKIYPWFVTRRLQTATLGSFIVIFWACIVPKW